MTQTARVFGIADGTRFEVGRSPHRVARRTACAARTRRWSRPARGGAAATTTVLLEGNGLDSLVERLISIDEGANLETGASCIGTPRSSWESNRVA